MFDLKSHLFDLFSQIGFIMEKSLSMCPHLLFHTLPYPPTKSKNKPFYVPDLMLFLPQLYEYTFSKLPPHMDIVLNVHVSAHLNDQACKDSSGHGWNFVTASLPGLSPCDRSSWSWKQWQEPEVRWSARRQWHTRTLLFFPTHLLACWVSMVFNK